MINLARWTVAVVALSASALLAQDITGTWQGTLHLPAGRDLRTVVKISKADTSGLKAVFYSIDQGGQGFPASSITLQGATLKFAIAAVGGTYEGKLANTDANSITGFWSQGGPQGPAPIALDLTLANDQTAWAIPELPPPPPPMAADASPQFEVATIKPTDSGVQGRGIGLRGRNFFTRNTPLSYLITFAYEIHPRQVTGGPGWMETDNYDLAGIPDKPGAPNDKQTKMMVQSLLADRFKLTFHHEKKELAVFAITVGKVGPTLTPSTANTNDNPSLQLRGLGTLVVRNATIADLAQLMQSSVLDRPVVDQTGLKGRFDFTLDWAPDETQFGAMGIKVPPPSENETRPNLFAAIQAQLGLKMEPVKAPVDVIVIDHVEKPSAN